MIWYHAQSHEYWYLTPNLSPTTNCVEKREYLMELWLQNWPGHLFSKSREKLLWWTDKNISSFWKQGMSMWQQKKTPAKNRQWHENVAIYSCSVIICQNMQKKEGDLSSGTLEHQKEAALSWTFSKLPWTCSKKCIS